MSKNLGGIKDGGVDQTSFNALASFGFFFALNTNKSGYDIGQHKYIRRKTLS